MVFSNNINSVDLFVDIIGYNSVNTEYSETSTIYQFGKVGIKTLKNCSWIDPRKQQEILDGGGGGVIWTMAMFREGYSY